MRLPGLKKQAKLEDYAKVTQNKGTMKGFIETIRKRVITVLLRKWKNEDAKIPVTPSFVLGTHQD